MKKYNTPEIEALALETIDVIASSGHDKALESLVNDYNVTIGGENSFTAEFTDNYTSQWSW